MPKKVEITIEEFRDATAIAFSLVLAKKKMDVKKADEIIDISTDAMVIVEQILFDKQIYNIDRILKELLSHEERPS